MTVNVYKLIPPKKVVPLFSNSFSNGESPFWNSTRLSFRAAEPSGFKFVKAL